MDIQKCNKCGADLNEKKLVYLAYMRNENKFYPRDNAPKNWDGEMFPFGKDCAKRMIKELK